MIVSGALDRLGLPLQGLTVSSPNKEMALAAVAAVTPAARRAGSANLIYRRSGQWIADTTDPAGVIETLAGRGIAVAGWRAAVVGCGGSGRAIASALSEAGANVVLSNRGRAAVNWLRAGLVCRWSIWRAFSPENFDLIVNATSVGRASAELPFACDRLAAGTVIVDLVYAPRPTPLGRRRGGLRRTCISGHEVLLSRLRASLRK